MYAKTERVRYSPACAHISYSQPYLLHSSYNTSTSTMPTLGRPSRAESGLDWQIAKARQSPLRTLVGCFPPIAREGLISRRQSASLPRVERPCLSQTTADGFRLSAAGPLVGHHGVHGGPPEADVVVLQDCFGLPGPSPPVPATGKRLKCLIAGTVVVEIPGAARTGCTAYSTPPEQSAPCWLSGGMAPVLKAPIFATQGASPERRRRGRADIRGGRSRRVDLVRVRVRVRVRIR